MICGLGIQIVSVAQVKQQLETDEGHGATIFTEREIAYCKGKRYPERHFAARLAAKRATATALGLPSADELWQDIETLNGRDGRPALTLRGGAKNRADESGAAETFVTLTHTREHAAAAVVLQRQD